MSSYSRVFGSQFPNEMISVGTKKDVDKSVVDLIYQYYNYMETGQLNAASYLYENNKDKLEPYIIDSAYLNRLSEEIYNTGILALSTLSLIVSDEEPTEQGTNGTWLQEF